MPSPRREITKALVFDQRSVRGRYLGSDQVRPSGVNVNGTERAYSVLCYDVDTQSGGPVMQEQRPRRANVVLGTDLVVTPFAAATAAGLRLRRGLVAVGRGAGSGRAVTPVIGSPQA